jgi:S-adenosylmethionine-diacylglycerol 3-amino-3-carboxypropyl transferase
MSTFLTRINYSSVNEDSTSEFAALRLVASDRCLCITGSGARPLDLITQPVGEIVALDMNPCQNHLLELKLAAIRSLTFDVYRSFIGVTPAADRLRTYALVRSMLTADARHYWDRHEQAIEHGVLYQGSWERHFRILANYLQATRGDRLRALFAASSIEEQAAIWDREWDTIAWRVFLKLATSRWNRKYLLRDPAFFQYVEKDMLVYEYVYSQLHAAAHSMLLRNSPLATLLFLGKLDVDEALPPHLQEKHYAQLQAQVDRITIVTARLGSMSNSALSGRFHAFSISDVASYTDRAAHEQIWRGMIDVAEPGARICERQFLVKRGIPASLAVRCTRDRALESQLAERDSSLFYTFICATNI